MSAGQLRDHRNRVIVGAVVRQDDWSSCGGQQVGYRGGKAVGAVPGGDDERRARLTRSGPATRAPVAGNPFSRRDSGARADVRHLDRCSGHRRSRFLGTALCGRLLADGARRVVCVDDLLGWAPKVGAAKGLGKTLAWFADRLAPITVGTP